MRLISSSPKLPRRHLLILPPLLLLAIVYFCLNRREGFGSSSSLRGGSKLASTHLPSKFWQSFAPVLEATAPKCPPPVAPRNATASSTHLDASHKVLNMSTADIACLHRSHALFVDLINFGAPRLEFKKGTKGLATLATKSGFPVLLINLFMLRRTSSSLPLEVFLETEDEYEPDMCEVVLPRWNATCIVLSSLLGTTKHNLQIVGTQLWGFALLFSSFESVLFLGSGSFLTRSPDELFDSKAFAKTGLVLWPSKEVSLIPRQESQIFGMGDGITSDLSAIDHRQILISKKHHTNVLSLVAYYSIYNAYYGPLMSELRIVSLAAVVMTKPFYQIDHLPHQLGATSATSAILQFDPASDFNCTFPCRPEAMFIHTNWLSPESGLMTTMGILERFWGSEEESRSLYSQDIEASAWGSVTSALCNSEMVFHDWEVCHKARMRLSYVFGSSQMNDYGGNES
ncbi:glycosyltransferase family 71 protein [Cadophora sp. DSE1049]|nr:glycosyltransferase family 71 protein [Cadophora sp. DSE1049]